MWCDGENGSHHQQGERKPLNRGTATGKDIRVLERGEASISEAHMFPNSCQHFYQSKEWEECNGESRLLRAGSWPT